MPTKTGRDPLQPPPAAQLLLALTNTHAGGQAERLGDAEGLRAWLKEIGFADAQATDADAANAREFRDALQTLLLSHAGDAELTPEAVEAAEAYLRRLAERHPLSCIVTASGASVEPTQTGMHGAFATILAGVSELAHTELWNRLKACRNPICHEAFFDHSRNASALYHGSQCTSMMAMRAYRQRKQGPTS